MNPLKISMIFALLLAVAACTTSKQGNYNTFAECIGSKATMYGTEWCPHCKNQKAMFGSSFANVDYVDCDIQKQSCLENAIRGYPTWVIDGEQYSGEQSLDRLAELTGCPLVKDDIAT